MCVLENARYISEAGGERALSGLVIKEGTSPSKGEGSRGTGTSSWVLKDGAGGEGIPGGRECCA